MANEYFVGLRGTSDLATHEDPDAWRLGILRLFPNGMMPLTGLTALMKSEKVPNAHYHWWTKTLSLQRATLQGSGIHEDAACGDPYDAADDYAAGTTVYAKITLAAAKEFREGYQVLIRLSTDYANDINAKITGIFPIDATYASVACRLLEADGSARMTSDMSFADTMLAIGSINPQGGTRPEAIGIAPVELESYTQIFRDSLDLTRTLMETKLRTANAYLEAKKDALELHGIGMEKAFLWGVGSVGVGANGKPETTTSGLLYWIRTYGTVQDYVSDPGASYAGKTWLEGGEQWLDEHFEEIFRYGSSERLAFCGSGALLGLQRLIKDLGMFTLTSKTTSWGTKVLEWITPFGTITFKTHPLFSYEATNRHSMVVIEPKNLRYRYITDTRFAPDIMFGKGGGTGKDGKEEDFLTEAGLEIHFPETTGFLNGIGKDNTAA